MRPACATWALLCTAAGAQACGEGLGADAQSLRDTRYQVVFKATPSPIPVGQHFRLDFVLCPMAPAAAPGERPQAHDVVRLPRGDEQGGSPAREVTVDAQMPEHRHGMNYRPTIRSLGAGLYRAEGLMFHMPGRWELVFEIRGSDGAVRLTQSLLVE